MPIFDKINLHFVNQKPVSLEQKIEDWVLRIESDETIKMSEGLLSLYMDMRHTLAALAKKKGAARPFN